jgi:hypothetical protein
MGYLMRLLNMSEEFLGPFSLKLLKDDPIEMPDPDDASSEYYPCPYITLHSHLLFLLPLYALRRISRI